MNLSIGIVGLPNVGKSTLFNALLKRQAALAANYPFATIEPNIGVVDVPDSRLNGLVEIVRNEYGNKAGSREVPEKIIPAVVKFYDIAGLVKGAHKGEGLGNAFLGHIREVDAILHVVRMFDDENISRAGSTTPEEDKETINTELLLADLATIEKRISTFERQLRSDPSKENKEKDRLYKVLLENFNKNILAANIGFSAEEKMYLKDLNLLTLKPMLYVYNIDESLMGKVSEQRNLSDLDTGIPVCAKIEEELAQLPEDEKEEYLSIYNMEESGINEIIRKSYETLGLQTFLTAGPKEVKAWTIKKGSTAPEAAGTIHTDFQRGFISAEVISYSDLVEAGSYKNAKEKGLVRLEGKNYVMQDGDVVEFRFSV